MISIQSQKPMTATEVAGPTAALKAPPPESKVADMDQKLTRRFYVGIEPIGLVS